MPKPILDPRQRQFWSDAERDLWAKLAPLLLKIHIAGAVSGEKLLPANLRVLVNWDRVNSAAIDYLHQYRISWVSKITDYTRDQAIKSIDTWIRNGEPLPNLEARLSPILGDMRAARVAATETTRIYQTGHETAWISSGMVEEFEFRTNVDERVCPQCGPRHGQAYKIGDIENTPPIHVNCRCFSVPRVKMENVGNEIERAIEEA
jgi:SPP1 gp7 family putative phage head morphogenesis protein